ncbi:hypothetical protein M0R72_06580 [Candidatus Pacearchaeota archaeon]|jgi:hypothetical protein|nr:hypothetical protein [Candidatus Pacearchaeota archaeon]
MTEHMAYIAVKSCGCVVGAVVDIPECRKETAKDVAEWIRNGLTIERVPSAEVKTLLKACHCDEKQISMGLK